MAGPAMQRHCADWARILFAHWQGLSLLSPLPLLWPNYFWYSKSASFAEILFSC